VRHDYVRRQLQRFSGRSMSIGTSAAAE